MGNMFDQDISLKLSLSFTRWICFPWIFYKSNHFRTKVQQIEFGQLNLLKVSWTELLRFNILGHCIVEIVVNYCEAFL